MEVSITKISQNGQLVIPAEIRRDAKIKPKTKFLIFNKGNEIMLKPITEGMLMEEIDLMRRVERSEREIEKGKAVKANTRMPTKDIDDLLMA